MSETARFITDLAALVAEIPDESIVSRTVHTDEQMRVVLFGFAPGQELTEHTSAHPAVLHFLSGEAEVTLGDQTHTAVAGAWMHMPARLPHSVVARTQVMMLLTMFKNE